MAVSGGAGLPAGPALGKGGIRAPSGPSYSSALFQPSQTLQGKQLGQAAGQIASLQTQGPISQLAAQIAKDRAQGSAAQGQTFSYYLQLARDAQNASGQQSGINSNLQSQLAGIGQNTQQQLSQFGQQAQGGAVGRAAALGLDGGSQGMLGAQTAQQRGVGALNAQAFQSAGANQGANYAQHAAGENQTIDLRGQERLGDIGRATQLSVAPLNQKIADLRDKTGALTATALGQLRQQERNYQIANAGLGIKQSSLRLTAANDAAKNALTLRGQNITAAHNAATEALTASGQGITQARDAANAAYHQALVTGRFGGGSKPLSSAQNSKLQGQISRATGVIQQAQAYRGGTHPNGYTEGEIRANLASKYALPDYVIQAAYELLGYGSLSAHTAAFLHGIGMRGGTFRGQPINVSHGGGGGSNALAGAVTGAVGSAGNAIR